MPNKSAEDIAKEVMKNSPYLPTLEHLVSIEKEYQAFASSRTSRYIKLARNIAASLAVPTSSIVSVATNTPDNAVEGAANTTGITLSTALDADEGIGLMGTHLKLKQLETTQGLLGAMHDSYRDDIKSTLNQLVGQPESSEKLNELQKELTYNMALMEGQHNYGRLPLIINKVDEYAKSSEITEELRDKIKAYNAVQTYKALVQEEYSNMHTKYDNQKAKIGTASALAVTSVLDAAGLGPVAAGIRAGSAAAFAMAAGREAVSVYTDTRTKIYEQARDMFLKEGKSPQEIDKILKENPEVFYDKMKGVVDEKQSSPEVLGELFKGVNPTLTEAFFNSPELKKHMLNRYGFPAGNDESKKVFNTLATSIMTPTTGSLSQLKDISENTQKSNELSSGTRAVESTLGLRRRIHTNPTFQTLQKKAHDSWHLESKQKGKEIAGKVTDGMSIGHLERAMIQAASKLPDKTPAGYDVAGKSQSQVVLDAMLHREYLGARSKKFKDVEVPAEIKNAPDDPSVKPGLARRTKSSITRVSDRISPKVNKSGRRVAEGVVGVGAGLAVPLHTANLAGVKAAELAGTQAKSLGGIAAEVTGIAAVANEGIGLTRAGKKAHDLEQDRNIYETLFHHIKS